MKSYPSLVTVTSPASTVRGYIKAYSHGVLRELNRLSRFFLLPSANFVSKSIHEEQEGKIQDWRDPYYKKFGKEGISIYGSGKVAKSW